jgi:uroporphyrin-3 C-methyltransferase
MSKPNKPSSDKTKNKPSTEAEKDSEQNSRLEPQQTQQSPSPANTGAASQPSQQRSEKTDLDDAQDDSTASQTETEERSAQVDAEATVQQQPSTGHHPPSEARGSDSEADKTDRSGKILRLMQMLLLLLLLSVTAWVGYQQWQQEQRVSAQLTSQNSILEQQNGQLQQLRAQLQQQQQQLAQLSQQQAADQSQAQLLRQQLIVTQEKLRLLSSKGRQEWMLEQAHYYLNLAQQKLLFEHNPSTAMALLAEADATLADSGDLNLTQLRQAIQNDLAALAAIPSRDQHALLLRLNALQQQVAQLTPQAIQLPEPEEQPQADNKAWFDRLMVTLDKFGEDAFKFRTHDHQIQPLLSDEHKAVLQAVLQLALTQAQTAVIKGDQNYYQSRLRFADELLKHYFQLNDQGAALSAQLTELQQAAIEPPPTYQLTSLPLMEEFKQQRRLQWYSESVPSDPASNGNQP